MPFKIVIVGGGIAGLAAAIALRKDEREIIVLEQSSLNREIGATISLQPNASKIVGQQWGLDAVLQAKGSMIDEGFQVYNLDGELQIQIPLKTTDKYGSERIILHRQDLHETLKERATSISYPGRPATIRVSSRVVSCDCNKGEVALSDGTKMEADLVIGADGIKSNLRKFVVGQEIPTLKTGFSAYRMVIPIEELLSSQSDSVTSFSSIINPKSPFTTMVMGHSCRLIMGPARNSSIYSIVAMVPDETMNESPSSPPSSSETTWTTPGNQNKMLETFSRFPAWAKQPLELARPDDLGLWQLRDIDPLPNWHKGRVILSGDAAHAMLPTQGQGASQSIEDAEALGAFFEDIDDDNNNNNNNGGRTASSSPTFEDVEKVNSIIFETRYDRATLIQGYSRQIARPATDGQSAKIQLNPAQFMDYNCLYDGAKAWREKMLKERNDPARKEGATSPVEDLIAGKLASLKIVSIDA